MRRIVVRNGAGRTLIGMPLTAGVDGGRCRRRAVAVLGGHRWDCRTGGGDIVFRAGNHAGTASTIHRRSSASRYALLVVLAGSSCSPSVAASRIVSNDAVVDYSLEMAITLYAPRAPGEFSQSRESRRQNLTGVIDDRDIG